MNRVSASNNGHMQQQPLSDEAATDETKINSVRVAIVGTGFSGLGMAIRLKQDGCNDFVIIEKASDLGGTWRDNTYPGCACDIPSDLYSFSFAMNPHWSRSYPRQPEIQSYLQRCAERYGLLPHIRGDSELQDATWNEQERRWHLMTAQGPLIADILIVGNGPLSEPSLPSIAGIENFEGVLFHSAQWRHDYDLTGKRVAVIGTGASAIQFVPQIQPKVAALTLFLRTPPWIVPRMDAPIAAWQRALYRILPVTQRFVRARIYWLHELTAIGLVYRQNALAKAAEAAQQHMRRQVSDPVLREKLTPRYMMGCKRILLSDDFYPAVTQPNVNVVSERIREVRAHSIVTEDGNEHEVDVIICGTGFHVTDAHLPQFVHGRGGQSLAESWQTGSHAYLGSTVAGFPNLFLLIGPNTGLGHNSMVYMIESQLSYILDCMHIMERQHIQAVEVQPEREEAYNTEMQQRMKSTVWISGCSSWYLDANGRNTTLWPGFTFEFRRRTRHFDRQYYTMNPAKETSYSH